MLSTPRCSLSPRQLINDTVLWSDLDERSEINGQRLTNVSVYTATVGCPISSRWHPNPSCQTPPSKVASDPSDTPVAWDIGAIFEGYLQGVPSSRGLGWVDLNFQCSTVCPIRPGLIGVWQKRLGKMAEHPNISQSIPVPGAHGTPCTATYIRMLTFDNKAGSQIFFYSSSSFFIHS